LAFERIMENSSDSKQRCFICSGKGKCYALVPSKIEYLSIVKNVPCRHCAGTGFLAVGICRDCEKKGWWFVMKDGCIYCNGKNTAVLDKENK